MKYTELKKRLGKMNAIKKEVVDLKKGTIELSYLASTISDEITTRIFNINISDELQKIFGLTGEDKGDVEFKDIDDNTVLAMPSYRLNEDGYKSWKGGIKCYLFLNDEIIHSEAYVISQNGNRTIYAYISPFINIIGIWNDYIIAERANGYYIILNNNTAKEICEKYEPESGNPNHVKAFIEDDNFIQMVFEHYDCDLKHGDWEAYEFDLNDYL